MLCSILIPDMSQMRMRETVSILQPITYHSIHARMPEKDKTTQQQPLTNEEPACQQYHQTNPLVMKEIVGEGPNAGVEQIARHPNIRCQQ